MGRPYIDLTGQRFGKLTVLELAEHGGSHKAVKWRCRCDCGGEKIADSQMLRRGYITDCGCKIRDRLVGQRFGRLVVVRDSGIRKDGVSGIIWECKCDCGNTAYVLTSNLMAKKNFTASCGCMRREKSTKHGLSNHPIYKVLVSMKGRCKNPNNPKYDRYGGRGITICEEWDGEHGFENFYNWSMENGYAPGLSIDRIDNDKGYSPDNCRWTTPKVQMNNQSRNRMITFNGETHSVADWSRINGICLGTIRDRLMAGWPEDVAVSKPPLRRKREQ